MTLNDGPGWAPAAAERGWRSKRGKPLAYRQLWQRILELDGCLAATWRHVLGHRPKKDTSDDARYNREADVLAGQARRNFLELPAPQASAAIPLRTPRAAGSWRDLPNRQKADHLRATPTISDASWTDEQRLPGESRTAFIGRVLDVGL
jgi:hypothetical protein